MARRRVGYWALHLVAALLSAPLLHLQSTSLLRWLVTARPSGREGGSVPARCPSTALSTCGSARAGPGGCLFHCCCARVELGGSWATVP